MSAGMTAIKRVMSRRSQGFSAIVFANRKTTVALLEKSLKTHGFNAGALHGDMDQSARLKMLTAFRNNEVTYLIASDVAARGLDIPEVSHVFNFDVPIHAEDYVHRIGRTGRAGREGHAFTMVTKEETKYLKAIETLIAKEIPWFETGLVIEETQSSTEHKPSTARRARKASKPTRDVRETPKSANPAPQQFESARPPKSKKPHRSEERPANRHPKIHEAPDDDSFHSGNMPAFLTRR